MWKQLFGIGPRLFQNCLPSLFLGIRYGGIFLSKRICHKNNLNAHWEHKQIRIIFSGRFDPEKAQKYCNMYMRMGISNYRVEMEKTVQKLSTGKFKDFFLLLLEDDSNIPTHFNKTSIILKYVHSIVYCTVTQYIKSLCNVSFKL